MPGRGVPTPTRACSGGRPLRCFDRQPMTSTSWSSTLGTRRLDPAAGHGAALFAPRHQPPDAPRRSEIGRPGHAHPQRPHGVELRGVEPVRRRVRQVHDVEDEPARLPVEVAVEQPGPLDLERHGTAGGPAHELREQPAVVGDVVARRSSGRGRRARTRHGRRRPSARAGAARARPCAARASRRSPAATAATRVRTSARRPRRRPARAPAGRRRPRRPCPRARRARRAVRPPRRAGTCGRPSSTTARATGPAPSRVLAGRVRAEEVGQREVGPPPALLVVQARLARRDEPAAARDETPHGRALRVRHRREVRQDEHVQLRRRRARRGRRGPPATAGGAATSASTAPANGCPVRTRRLAAAVRSRCSPPTTRRRPSRSAGGRRGTPRSPRATATARSAVRSWRRSSWLAPRWCHHGWMPAAMPSTDHSRASGLGLRRLAEHRPRRPEVEAGLSGASLSQPRTPWTTWPATAFAWKPSPGRRICQSSMTIARARPDRASGGGSRRTSRRGRPGTCRASRSRARPPRASRGCTRPRSRRGARSSSGSTRGTRRRPSPRGPAGPGPPPRGTRRGSGRSSRPASGRGRSSCCP